MECAYHPDRDAVSKCSQCGKPLCKECGRSLGDMCPDCAVSQVKNSAETARHSLMNWKGWLYSFAGHSATFTKSRQDASFAGVAMDILVGAINAGILSVLFVVLNGEGQKLDSLLNSFTYALLFLLFVVVWLINSLISYSFAMLAGGVGSLKQHMYLLSLFLPFSPIAIAVTALLLGMLFSFQFGLGLAGAIVLGIYVTRIHANAMMEAHKFKLMQATLSWTIPCAMSIVGIGLLIFVSRII